MLDRKIGTMLKEAGILLIVLFRLCERERNIIIIYH